MSWESTLNLAAGERNKVKESSSPAVEADAAQQAAGSGPTLTPQEDENNKERPLPPLSTTANGGTEEDVALSEEKLQEADRGGGGGSRRSSSSSSSGEEEVRSAPKVMARIPARSQQERDDMIERYYQLQKEKRDLRRRNMQAQTNIVQYFRKHKLNPYPNDPDKNPAMVRDDYNKLLHRIDALVREKEQESSSFASQMQEILEKKQSLQTEISRLIHDMVDIRARAAKESFHVTSGRTLSQKDLNDHNKSLEVLAVQMQPIRLQFAKLNRRLEGVYDKWSRIVRTRDQGIDSVELTLENQVYGEKAEQRLEEISQLEQKIQVDVIVLSHAKMKYEQVLAENEDLDSKLQEKVVQRDELKRTLNSMKSELGTLITEAKQMEEKLGLLFHQKLLTDYVATYRRLSSLEIKQL